MGMGQQFYVESPEEEFIKRIDSWLNYLGIAQYFPNLDSLQDEIFEVGERLRNAADTSYFGVADRQNHIVLIRPWDYATLLHEITHNNPRLKKTILSSEAGAFALEIICVGDFDFALDSLLGSRTYSKKDKILCKIITEASLVLGLKLVDFLVQWNNNISQKRLINSLKQLIDEIERGYFIEKSHSAVDYLVDFQGLTPRVAEYLLNITGDTQNTILRSITQTKKDVIGAFRGLVSFYHINLGYTLNDAISKTEIHFERNEAQTIYKTLTTGAKEVFAKLREHGYPLEVCQKVSETLISFGGSKSKEYATSVPLLLELISQFGYQGKEFLGFVLSNKAFFDVLCLTNYSKSLLNLSKTEPELVPKILGELALYDWSKSTVSFREFRSFSIDSHMRRKVLDLPPDIKAKSFALIMYVLSLKKDKQENFIEYYGFNPIPTSRVLFLSMVAGDEGFSNEEKILRLVREIQSSDIWKKLSLKEQTGLILYPNQEIAFLREKK